MLSAAEGSYIDRLSVSFCTEATMDHGFWVTRLMGQQICMGHMGKTRRLVSTRDSQFNMSISNNHINHFIITSVGLLL